MKIEHADIDAMFASDAAVGDLSDDRRTVEQLAAAACEFGHRIVDLVPNGAARTSAIRKLCEVVTDANAAISRENRRNAARSDAHVGHA